MINLDFNLKNLILLGFLLASTSGFGQQKWSLQKCIQYAQENGLDIKRAELSVQDASLQELSAKQSRLPSVSASIGGGSSFGRRIDPSTNTFVNSQIGYNSGSIGANITLYNGGQIKNTIKQSGINRAASQADLDQGTQNMALNVAVAFLNILLAEDQLENTKKQMELTTSQLLQTERLIEAGNRPAADLLDIKAQLAQNEQLVVNRENDVALNYLKLTQLLELPPDKPFKIVRPSIEIPADSDPENFKLTNVYQKAVNNQPGIQAGELRVEAAKVAIDIAAADRLPRLTAFAEISSNYSSLGRRLTGQNVQVNQVQNVQIDFVGPDPIPITFLGESPVTEDAPYFNQLNTNFGQAIGLNLQVPIYSKGQVKTAIQRSELALLNSEITDQANKQQLKQDIQLAIADALAGKKNYEAAKKTEEALLVAYQNTEKKYKLGAANTLEYTTAKNQLDQSTVETIIAKYDYIFKLKVVDFYEGKRIKL